MTVCRISIVLITFFMNWNSIIFKNAIYLKAKFKNIAYRFYPEPKPGKWLFISGCYNSGTTLLADVLGLHPQIGTMPLEGRRFTDELKNADAMGIPRLWALKPEEFYLNEAMGEHINVSRIKRQWAYMYNDFRKPVLLEKSPVNSGRTRWFQHHFENSYFVIIFRNGYAVAEGIRRKAGHSIENSLLQWVRSNEIILADMPFLQNKLVVSYEKLTANPQDVFSQITRFLDLPELPAEIFSKKFKVHERRQSIENFNDSSLKNLTSEEIALINSLAGEMLLKLGYKVINLRI